MYGAWGPGAGVSGTTTPLRKRTRRPGSGGDAVAGDDDAGEVHGVGGGDLDDGVVGLLGLSAEGFDGFGEGELLAGEAGDEAAAADLAAGFEAAEDGE